MWAFPMDIAIPNRTQRNRITEAVTCFSMLLVDTQQINQLIGRGCKGAQYNLAKRPLITVVYRSFGSFPHAHLAMLPDDANPGWRFADASFKHTVQLLVGKCACYYPALYAFTAS